MLTYINMMTGAQSTSGLAPRLERLTGIDAECCVSEYEDLSDRVTRSPEFSLALKRARALADEGRLTAVALLHRHRELCACEIQAALGVSHATVSHHMGILIDAGLVAGERRGKWTYYRLAARAGVDIP